MAEKIRKKIQKEVEESNKIIDALSKLNKATGIKGLLISGGIKKVKKWQAKRKKIKLESILAAGALNDAIAEEDEELMIKKLEELEEFL